MGDRGHRLGAEWGGDGDGPDHLTVPGDHHHRVAPVVPLGHRAVDRAGQLRRHHAADLDRVPGDGSGHAWGCDLSADYVRINADYTT